MSSIKAIILKSGFFSLGDEDNFELIITDKKQDPRQRPGYHNIQNILGNARMVNDFEQGPYYTHKDARVVFDLMRRDSVFLKDFDNRERILNNALCCFGHRDFETWCLAQLHTPYLSASHTLYIKETLEYLLYGKRSYLDISWDMLLDKEEQNELLDKNVQDLKNVLAAFKQNNVNADMSIEGILSLWTAKKGGFKDLVIFLRNVFGRI